MLADAARYTTTCVLGEGTFGVVSKVWDSRQLCSRALKSYKTDEDGDIVSEAEAFWAAQGFRRDRTDATGELARRLAESTNVNVSGTIIMVLSFDDDEAPE